MGIIQQGIPKDITITLAKLYDIDVFCETGTGYGGTSRWASDNFSEIYTIEKSEYLLNHNKEILTAANITAYLGDSRDKLPSIIKMNEYKNILFWLDGHYSGGYTAGEEDPCPLMGELDIILKRTNDDIILIDDARSFLDSECYPTVKDIMDKITNSGGGACGLW
ncbi:hypothetical protein FACS1894137_12360 [Spirochaetia bacterium]|nr:hypothetical protein FACS1894137_12360 [Spirochaetia bacterium]